MKKILILLAFGSAGCWKKAEGPAVISNKYIDSEKLFTDAQGYTVYRFYDNEYHYYVVPGPVSVFGSRSRKDIQTAPK